MITTNRTKISPCAGETDCCLQPGQMNDPADAGATTRQILTGSWFFPDGTNGAIFGINLTAVAGANGVDMIEVQSIMGGVAQTVEKFGPGLNFNVARGYRLQLKPAASPGSWDGSIQGSCPNEGQLLITLLNKTDNVVGSVHVESSY